LVMADLPFEPDTENFGPAMLALSEQQRRFVLAWIADGGKGKAAKAAAAAGYSTKSEANKVRAWHLLRNPKIEAAIREEAQRHFGTTIAVKAMLRLGELVENDDPKVSASAIDSVLDRVGPSRHHTQDVRVEKVDARGTAELLKAIENIRQRALPVMDTTAETVK